MHGDHEMSGSGEHPQVGSCASHAAALEACARVCRDCARADRVEGMEDCAVVCDACAEVCLPGVRRGVPAPRRGALPHVRRGVRALRRGVRGGVRRPSRAVTRKAPADAGASWWAIPDSN